MTDRSGLFAGDNPFDIVRAWLAEAQKVEPNDPNAVALSTVDGDGMPNARIVLLKDVEDDGFVFFTNYGSTKGQELDQSGKAAFVIHWKSLRRQIRVRGIVTREDGPQADSYFMTRNPKSRLGAWASQQSRPLASRDVLVAQVEQAAAEQGPDPIRPPFWGGFRICPVEIEFWADGASRLHDRFRWSRKGRVEPWKIDRLYP
jgi:pyridoxamine 5'-phosphate oxidase